MPVSPHELAAANHYLQLLRRLEVEFTRHRESAVGALKELEENWPQISHLQRWAARCSSEDDRAAEICADLPVAASVMVDVWLPPRDRFRWAVQGARAARRLKDRKRETRVVGRIGLALSDFGKHRWACRIFEHQHTMAITVGDQKTLGDAIGNLGLALKRCDRHREAVRRYIEQYRWCAKIADSAAQGRALGNLAVALRHLKHLRLAEQVLHRRMRIAESVNDARGAANTRLNLGLLALDRGEFRAAMRWFAQARSGFHRIGDLRGVARSVGSIGKVFMSIGDRSEARRYLGRALSMFKQHRFVDESRHAEELLAQLKRGGRRPLGAASTSGESSTASQSVARTIASTRS